MPLIRKVLLRNERDWEDFRSRNRRPISKKETRDTPLLLFKILGRCVNWAIRELRFFAADLAIGYHWGKLKTIVRGGILLFKRVFLEKLKLQCDHHNCQRLRPYKLRQKKWLIKNYSMHNFQNKICQGQTAQIQLFNLDFSRQIHVN